VEYDDAENEVDGERDRDRDREWLLLDPLEMERDDE